MIENNDNISIRELINDIQNTKIFHEIIKRNGEEFALEFAFWIVRYILVITSMNETLRLDLELILKNFHGEKYKDILEITNKVFHIVNEERKQ